MASPPNFRISPGTPSGTTDLFLPIFANHFLIPFMFIMKVTPEVTNFTSGMLRSEGKTDV
jgi:hypothetical protein